MPEADTGKAALTPGLEVIPPESPLQWVDRLTRREAIAAQVPPAPPVPLNAPRRRAIAL